LAYLPPQEAPALCNAASVCDALVDPLFGDDRELELDSSREGGPSVVDCVLGRHDMRDVLGARRHKLASRLCDLRKGTNDKK
jgi:hypothetical protein